jgi:hypothetical protein
VVGTEELGGGGGYGHSEIISCEIFLRICVKGRKA